MNYTIISSICPKCGKPYVFYGDVPTGGLAQVVCQCPREPATSGYWNVEGDSIQIEIRDLLKKILEHLESV